MTRLREVKPGAWGGLLAEEVARRIPDDAQPIMTDWSPS